MPRAQIVLIGTIATTDIARETWKKSRRERGGNKRRKVYREVSFNSCLRGSSYPLALTQNWRNHDTFSGKYSLSLLFGLLSFRFIVGEADIAYPVLLLPQHLPDFFRSRLLYCGSGHRRLIRAPNIPCIGLKVLLLVENLAKGVVDPVEQDLVMWMRGIERFAVYVKSLLQALRYEHLSNELLQSGQFGDLVIEECRIKQRSARSVDSHQQAIMFFGDDPRGPEEVPSKL